MNQTVTFRCAPVKEATQFCREPRLLFQPYTCRLKALGLTQSLVGYRLTELGRSPVPSLGSAHLLQP